MDFQTMLQNNMDYIDFLYGLIFILIGTLSFTLRKLSNLPWIWLSLFGLVLGFSHWSSLIEMSSALPPIFKDIRFGLELISCIAILEFWRRIVSFSSLLVYSLLGIVSLFSFWQYPESIHLLLYSVAAISSIVLGFMGLRKIFPGLVLKNFRIIALTLILFQFVHLFAHYKFPFFGIDSIDQKLFSFAAETLSTLLGIIILYSLWFCYLYRESDSENSGAITFRQTSKLLLSLGGVLVLGWFLVYQLGEHRKNLLTQEMVMRATVASKSLDREKIAHLTATESDIGTPEYEELKLFLMNIKVMSRFLYLMTLREGKVFFLLDSEPSDSSDVSPAGQEYSEVEPEFVKMLQQNKPFIYGPYSDRWGTWISVVIPLNLFLENQTPVYYACDIDGLAWTREIYHDRLFGIGIVLIFSILVLYFYLSSVKIYKINLILQKSEKRFRMLVESSSDWIWEVDARGHYTYASPRIKVLLGYEPEEIIGKTPFDFMPAEESARLADRFLKLLSSKLPLVALENINLHKNGTRVILETNAIPIIAADGTLLGYRGVDRDITERKRAEESVKKISQRMELHFNQAPFAIIEWDTDFRVIAWNPAAEKIFGFAKEEAVGKTAMELILPPKSIGHVSHVWDDLLGNQGGQHGINENRNKEGKIILCEWTNTTLVDITGEIVGVASIAEDITEKKQFEQKIEYLAYYDELTGLPNRALFKNRIEHELRKAKRDHAFVGIVFIDIDFFKHVNETLGHTVGDILLQSAASRFKQAFRESDTLARFGGDEFTVIIPDLKQPEEIERVLQNILDQFKAPFAILEHELYVTVSIGYSFYPLDETDPEMLLSNAEAAMYAAKETGRNTFRRYNSEMISLLNNYVDVHHGLIKAIEKGEFLLYYQPQFDIASEKIIGAEALIRWNHPEKGIVNPGEFIQIAEKTGLIVPIGEWVLRTACQQVKTLHKQGFDSFVIAVNLSARQFGEEGFAQKVIEIIRETGIDPAFIELELTESILINNANTVLKVLEYFKDAGFALSIDDFGTGYSSLSYLKLFPIDKLKIDQAFTRNVTLGGSDSDLVRAIIAMASALHLTTIAEGVETQEQLTFMQAMGCNEIQGYLIAKPMPGDELEVFLTHQK